MKSNRGIANIAIVMVVLLLLAAGAGIILWQQTKLPAVPAGEATPPPAPSGVEGPAPEVVATTTDTDTANWKTYRNEEFGFEFKYPAGWRLMTQTKEDLIDIRLSDDIQYGPPRLAFHKIGMRAEEEMWVKKIRLGGYVWWVYKGTSPSKNLDAVLSTWEYETVATDGKHYVFVAADQDIDALVGAVSTFRFIK